MEDDEVHQFPLGILVGDLGIPDGDARSVGHPAEGQALPPEADHRVAAPPDEIGDARLAELGEERDARVPPVHHEERRAAERQARLDQEEQGQLEGVLALLQRGVLEAGEGHRQDPPCHPDPGQQRGRPPDRGLVEHDGDPAPGPGAQGQAHEERRHGTPH